MKKYRVVVNKENCLGDRWCCDIAPETFGRDDEDMVVVKDEAGNWPEYILKAAMTCPNDCITLYDGETGERVWPKPGKS